MLLGWGRINPNNNALSPYLKQAAAPVASHSQCRQRNGGTVDESSMVCVGGRGSSVCNGDSGGPLSCTGRWQVGGSRCSFLGDQPIMSWTHLFRVCSRQLIRELDQRLHTR